MRRLRIGEREAGVTRKRCGESGDNRLCRAFQCDEELIAPVEGVEGAGVDAGEELGAAQDGEAAGIVLSVGGDS